MSNAKIQLLIEKELPQRLGHLTSSCAHGLTLAVETLEEAAESKGARSVLIKIFDMALGEIEETYHLSRSEIFEALGALEDENHQKLITPEKVMQMACEAA